MTDDQGVDFSFDCTGNPGVIYSAMECANPVCILDSIQLETKYKFAAMNKIDAINRS